MSAPIRICVVTGSRAEYGLLYWLMRGIAADPAFRLQVLATGMHLSPEFGLTWKRIEEDGFPISRKVEMLLSSDTPEGVTKSMGVGLIGFADAYADLRPDLVVLLGDRFETLCAATAATVARLPIAHLHGGERTEGAIDESFRHAITKMSHFHFTATEEYRRRVIQLGEAPERVHNVGAPGVDAIKKTPLLDREALQNDLGFRLLDRNLMITFHPVTLETSTSESQFRALLEALDPLPATGFIFTKANADTDGRVINRLIDEFAAARRDRAVAHTSLGRVRYLSALSAVDAVVGNSSSGLIEAPSFGIPTVNIGERQAGRLRPASVIDCAPEAGPIRAALEKALSPAFRGPLRGMRNPYGDGDAAERILAVLRAPWPDRILFKRFHDLPGAGPA
jgi:GDP/UDP-N,N'-diacetylbacillosamine 2-epimerase (hydrolysing)